MSLLRAIIDWVNPPMTWERGAACAKKFLATNPTPEQINQAFVQADHLHNDDFDRGWLDTLSSHISGGLKEYIDGP